ncbi:MAG: 3-deoxy-7-phosphoheptulonate synthase [Eubacteriales bacterium]|nr:3-deoxy-7-phosphoheptulonate synthase [Eubacteriales bacterium]MDY3332477.1 3-deoxy-7-phosphoheptulonate synthase [Gallibacter sp.]
MIIVLKDNPEIDKINALRDWLRSMDLEIHYSQGSSTTLMGLLGDTSGLDIDIIRSLPFVKKAIRIQEPYKLSHIGFKKEKTVVDVGGVKIGDGITKIIAGPCSVESNEQLIAIAESIKTSGGDVVRGGAYKPRTSPYTFQGTREEGMMILQKMKEQCKMPVVTEIMDIAHLEQFEHIDMIQVGARNMQNYELLRALGRQNKPVLLKRGFASTLEELLLSAEYILKEGNPNVILCERGIRTAANQGTITLDLSAVPRLKQMTHLPVIVDPSHGTGDSKIVTSMTLAAVACGADGVMVEVHNNPSMALCDGPQAIDLEEFEQLVKKIKQLRDIISV